MRYNSNYQCKGCGAEATAELLDCVLDYECQACGGRVWVKTHKHRLAVTVDDERFAASTQKANTIVDGWTGWKKELAQDIRDTIPK